MRRRLLVAALVATALGGLAAGVGMSRGDAARSVMAAPRDETSAAASGAADPAPPHPEWALADAASVGDYQAPAVRPSAAPSPRLPSWLTGQSDLSPAAVIQSWTAYARTQGPSLDAARELVAYAHSHPTRVADAAASTVDAWLVGAMAADRSVLQQMVAAGYLDDGIATLFENGDAAVMRDVVRDLDFASRCAGSSCAASWRVRYAFAGMEQASAADARARCVEVIPGEAWLLASDDPSAHDVARAMDEVLRRQREARCAA